MQNSTIRNNVSTDTIYSQPTPKTMSEEQKKLAIIGGVTGTGAIIGGGLGYSKYKNPVLKNGVVEDTFLKNTFANYVEFNPNNEVKETFSQIKNVLQNLKNVKNVDDFKRVLNNNSKVLDEQSATLSKDLFLNSIKQENLKDNIKNLQKVLVTKMDYEKQKVRDIIALAWDQKTKQFVQNTEFSDGDLFNLIKGTKYNSYWKKAIKYAGVSAILAGALAIGANVMRDVAINQKNKNNYLQ